MKVSKVVKINLWLQESDDVGVGEEVRVNHAASCFVRNIDCCKRHNSHEEQKYVKSSIRRYETIEPILGKSSRRVIYVYARITKGKAIPTYRQWPLQGKQDP